MSARAPGLLKWYAVDYVSGGSCNRRQCDADGSWERYSWMLMIALLL